MDAMSDLRTLLGELRADTNGRFNELRLDMNTRFADVNNRFDEVNRRLAALDQKSDRHFAWLVGTQVAVLLAVVGALLGAYYR